MPWSGCFSVLFLAFLHQQLIAGHLPDDLLCLRFGSVVKSGHGNLLPLQTASGRNVSPPRPLRPVPSDVTILSHSKTKRRHRRIGRMHV
jgi:hypothetical protein